MKKFNISIIFCLLVTICYPQENYNNEIYYYNQLASKQNINSYLTINEILKWFKYETTTTDIIVLKQSNFIIVGYYFFTDKKLTANLNIIFKENETIYYRLYLKMMINGKDRIYIDQDAIKTMLMLLNNNNNFNYHFK